MKKILTLALCALLILSLAGCGGAKTEAPAPTEVPAATEIPATEAPAVTEAPAATEAPAGNNDTAALKEKILAMVGQPVEDLYELVGQPVSEPDYTPSCLVTGGQDGQLEYDGFTVYTIVQPDGTETIYDCE